MDTNDLDGCLTGRRLFDDTTRAEVDEFVAAATARLGPDEAARIARRAQITGRADIVRSVVDALGELT